MFFFILSLFYLPSFSHDITAGSHAFSPHEFKASYQLMVQYKHGSTPTCPQFITYNEHPTVESTDLLVYHNNMKLGITEESQQNCTDGGWQRVTQSSDLKGTRLTNFVASLGGNIDRATVFNSLQSEISSGRYYISLNDTARVCGPITAFMQNENFYYFDETSTITLRLVTKIAGGVPKFLGLPLIGNVRYMVAVAPGTTCVYRVQSDVENVIRGSPRPSDSPSVSPTNSPSASITPSRSASPAAPLSNSPSPSGITITLPSMTSSTSPTKSPSASSSTSPAPSNSGSPSSSSTPASSPITNVPTGGASTLTPTTSSTTTSTPSTSTTSTATAMASSSSSPRPPSGTPSYSPTPCSACEPAKSVSITPTPSSGATSSAPSATPSPCSPCAPSHSTNATSSPSAVATGPTPSGAVSSGSVSPSASPSYGSGSGNLDGDRNSSRLDGTSTCFPGHARVKTPTGWTTMAELVIGDEIWTGDGFEKVVTFSHRNAHIWAQFEELDLMKKNTEGRRQRRRLVVSGGHYVVSNGRLVLAREVLVGDVMSGFVVTAKRWVNRKGLYNPHTGSGKMFVEDVEVSCYTENVPVMLGHAVLGAVRWMGMNGWAAVKDVGRAVEWGVGIWHKAHGEVYE